MVQQIVEFLHEFYEFFVVLLFRNPLAQRVHAFSFLRCHRASVGCQKLICLRRNTIYPMRYTDVNPRNFQPFVGHITEAGLRRTKQRLSEMRTTSAPEVHPLLPGCIASLPNTSACQESVCGQRSEPLHLFVNCAQQFRKNFVQLCRGGTDREVTETADSIIEAAQSHEDGRTWRCQNIARFRERVRYPTYCRFRRLTVPTDCNRPGVKSQTSPPREPLPSRPPPRDSWAVR